MIAQLGAVWSQMNTPGMLACKSLEDIAPPPESLYSFPLAEHPGFRKLPHGIGGPDYVAVSRAGAWDIGCDFDDPRRRQWIYGTYTLGPCEQTPQHVAYATLKSAATDYDPAPAAQACDIAMATISADVPLVNMARDLERLRTQCPQLVQAQTLLAGHFNTIEVADQVNAMLERFLAVGLRRTRQATAPNAA